MSVGGQISTKAHCLPVQAVALYMYQQLWSQLSGFLCVDDHYEGEMTSGKFQGVIIGSGVYMNKQKISNVKPTIPDTGLCEIEIP